MIEEPIAPYFPESYCDTCPNRGAFEIEGKMVCTECLAKENELRCSFCNELLDAEDYCQIAINNSLGEQTIYELCVECERDVTMFFGTKGINNETSGDSSM